MVNIAHRGASGHAPENTMAAFEKAFEMKADYIEIDVQMTKDGELIAIHDTTVNRTTNGTGSVGDYTLEEIQQLDAGSWFGQEFVGERIPTFEEIIDTYRGKIGLLIELKSPELYPGVEEKVAEALMERNMHKPNNEKKLLSSRLIMNLYNNQRHSCRISLMVFLQVHLGQMLQMNSWHNSQPMLITSTRI